MLFLTLGIFAATVAGDARADKAGEPGLSCSMADAGVDSDHGGDVVVDVSGLPAAGEAWCELRLAWNGFLLTSDHAEHGWVQRLPAERSGPGRLVCKVPPSPHAAEGPQQLWVVTQQKGACRANSIWYSTRLVASFCSSTYFAASWGELLVRANASVDAGSTRLRATLSNGKVLADAPVIPNGRSTINVSFAGLDTSFNGTVHLELFSGGGSLLGERDVRLRLVPERRRSYSAIDHKRRSILVDGHPFFPVGWFSEYLSYGEPATVQSLYDMARDGVNSIMLYNLIGGQHGQRFGRGKAPESPEKILDTAASLGMKLQIYLFDITWKLSAGETNDWDYLEEVVRRWRDHPAVLGWYVADDGAGPLLPEIYERIKAVDPYHIVTMAIWGTGDSVRTKYMQGVDVIMVESYYGGADFSFAQMDVLTRWPMEFKPTMVAGRSWTAWEDNGVLSVPFFRSQAYHALIGGAVGEAWFCYRNAENWNQPGLPLRAAAFEVMGQMLELAPALTSSSIWTADPPPSVTVTIKTMEGEAASPTAARARAFREEPGGCVTLLVASSMNEPVQVKVQFAYGSKGIYDDETDLTEALVPWELALPRRRVPVKRGALVEYLPSFGVQVFQLKGDCATIPLRPGVLEQPNLIFNPSFEQFGAYVGAPSYWDCAMSPLTVGAACSADASRRVDRRHSGRFVTGPDVKAFQIRPLVQAPPGEGLYEFSIWAHADLPMSLLVGTLAGESFTELGRAELTASWRQLRLDLKLNFGRGALGAWDLALRVNATGVLWLDDARLVLRPSAAPSPPPRLI